jgi:hypothetical protein
VSFSYSHQRTLINIVEADFYKLAALPRYEEVVNRSTSLKSQVVTSEEEDFAAISGQKWRLQL